MERFTLSSRLQHSHICVKKQYSNDNEVESHGEVHKYQCTKCSKLFSLKACFELHIKTCTVKKKTYKCKICMKSFTGNRSLANHMQMKHRMDRMEKLHTCTTCKKQFKVEDLLQHVMACKKKHFDSTKSISNKKYDTVEKHIEETRYQCNIQNKKILIKVFNCKSNPTTHI